MSDGFDFEIGSRPDYARLTVRMDAGDELWAEPGAMVSMDPTVRMESKLAGGGKLGAAIGRFVGGESLVVNRYEAGGAGSVTFSPGEAGDVFHYRIAEGRTLFLQRGAFLAHGPGVEVSGSWQGARGFFSGEGLVLLRASGSGDLWFNSYGAIVEVDVTDDYLVDTGYIVAFEDGLTYDISTVPGMGLGGQVKSFFFGGEGLVCRFRGQGRVWIQTRAVNPWLSWIHPFRRVQKSDDD